MGRAAYEARSPATRLISNYRRLLERFHLLCDSPKDAQVLPRGQSVGLLPSHPLTHDTGKKSTAPGNVKPFNSKSNHFHNSEN